MVLVPAGAPDDAAPVAIVPLMHRHEVEPRDVELHTTLRHAAGPALTPVPPDAKAIFFGACYHADYATLLAAPADLPAAAEALAAYCADGGRPGAPAALGRRGPPAAADGRPGARARSRRRSGAARWREGWTLNVEREEVCPVATLPVDGTLDDYLAHPGQEGAPRDPAQGPPRRGRGRGPPGRLARTRWRTCPRSSTCTRSAGAPTACSPTPSGGEQSRTFFRRLFELFGADGPLRLAFLTVDGRRIAAGVSFETADSSCTTTPAWTPRRASCRPACVMVERYVRRALERGARRLDFLRGDEPYKYEWGAVDEPIQRLLVRRTGGR